MKARVLPIKGNVPEKIGLVALCGGDDKLWCTTRAAQSVARFTASWFTANCECGETITIVISAINLRFAHTESKFCARGAAARTRAGARGSNAAQSRAAARLGASPCSWAR